MLNIQQIRHIRQLLDQKATTKLMLGLVVSHLDCCISIFIDIPEASVKCMQNVHNIAAKIVLKAGKYNSPKQCLFNMHWLLIWEWIDHKLLTLVHKCVHSKAPEYLFRTYSRIMYLAEVVHAQRRTVNLWYTKRKTFTQRSFSVQGVTKWNSLPLNIRSEEDTERFKCLLKNTLGIQCLNNLVYKQSQHHSVNL